MSYDHTGVILWGEHRVEKSLNTAEEWLEKYPGFKVGTESEAWAYDYLREHNPSLLGRIRNLSEKYNGRFGIGTCTYGQPLSCFIDGESNIRQLFYARECLQNHFDIEPQVYLMSEHAMHAQMPQLLRGFGFKSAIMRTFFQMYGHNPETDAPVVWWKGLDGSKMHALPTYVGGGAWLGGFALDNWIMTRYGHPQATTTLEEFRRQFSARGITPLLAARCDDVPWQHESLPADYHQKPGYTWILLEEIPRVFQEPEQTFTTKPGDFAVRMPWGLSANEIWNRDRESVTQVLTAERLAAIEVLFSGKARYDALLDDAWKNLLVAQHHDIQIGGRTKDSRQFHSQSIQASQKALGSAARSLITSKSRRATVVFNPLSWKRHDIVSAGGKDISLSIAPLSLSRITPPRDQRSTTITSIRKRYTVQNDFWDIDFDSQGTIAALRDSTGIDRLNPDRRNGGLAGVINGTARASKGTVSQITETPLVTRVYSEGYIELIPFRTVTTVYRHHPRIDFDMSVTLTNEAIGRLLFDQMTPSWQTDAGIAHEEKLRVRFYPILARQNAFGVRDVPFGIDETRDRYIQGIYWTALTDGHQGIGVFNRGTMCSVWERDGALSVPLAYSIPRDLWRRRRIEGTHRYRFSIMPFSGNWKDADLYRKALEYNFPVVVLPGKGSPSAPLQNPLIDIDSPNVILSALFPSENKVYMRLAELSGQATTTRIQLSGNLEITEEVDMRLKRISTPKSKRFRFKPWQIRTFRLFRPHSTGRKKRDLAS